MNHKDTTQDPKVAMVQDNLDSLGIIKDKDTFKLHMNDAYDKILDIPDDSLRKMVRKHGLNRFVNLKFPRASWTSRFMIKQVIKNRLQGSETFSENMNKTIPKLIFILIPFFALLLKLLYVRKKIPYFNHLIFSVHFLSFVFLLLLIKIFGSLVADWFSLLVYLLMMTYLYISLLKVYHQKRGKTFGKFILLFLGSLFMLGTFFIIAASVSFLMI